jgi:hypothetical protein
MGALPDAISLNYHFNEDNNMVDVMCRNPNLGLTTNAKAYKGAGQVKSLRVTFHAFKSVRECEGMNPHIHK